MKIKTSYANAPAWKEINVKSHIPESLKMLEEMARNIWWAWNYETTELYQSLDADSVSYTHLTLPTILRSCRSRWSPYH